jgi:hypothetical protein
LCFRAQLLINFWEINFWEAELIQDAIGTPCTVPWKKKAQHIVNRMGGKKKQERQTSGLNHYVGLKMEGCGLSVWSIGNLSRAGKGPFCGMLSWSLDALGLGVCGLSQDMMLSQDTGNDAVLGCDAVRA